MYAVDKYINKHSLIHSFCLSISLFSFYLFLSLSIYNYYPLYDVNRLLMNMHKIVGGGEVYHWTAYHLKDSSPEDRGRIKHIFAEPAMILNDIFYKFMGRYMCGALRTH